MPICNAVPPLVCRLREFDAARLETVEETEQGRETDEKMDAPAIAQTEFEESTVDEPELAE